MNESQLIAQCLRTAAALIDFAATLSIRAEKVYTAHALKSMSAALKNMADTV